MLGLGRREAPWLSRGPAADAGSSKARRNWSISVLSPKQQTQAGPPQGRGGTRGESLSELGRAGGPGAWARPGVWRSQRGEGCREGARGPGLSGFGQCPGILPSAKDAAQSAGAGARPVPCPGVSTSSPEGLGHPCAHTVPRVPWVPELTSKSHTLWGGGGPQGDSQASWKVLPVAGV